MNKGTHNGHSANSDEWAILERIYRILTEEGYLNGGLTSTERCQVSPPHSVVKFEHPVDLKRLIHFPMDEKEPSSEATIERIIRQVLHYSVRTGHPHFHNQLFAGVDPYGLTGSWITEALNTSQYTFEVGPTCTLIENAVIEKCLELFGFPATGDGILCPGGSMSNMYAIVAARFRAVPDVKRTGVTNLPTPLVVFTSEDAHYSITKAVHWLGIGMNNLIQVKTDCAGRMIPEELERAIESVIASGRRPFFVNATAGTTVLGAFDDFSAIADICARYAGGLWLHVDACLGGTAILSRTHRNLLAGVQRAQSLAWNPHKTLGAPLQCSVLVVQERGLLHECNAANADYLFQQDKFYDISYDTGDKSVQCGRKVDAFKFWLMYKARGETGLESLVDNAFECSRYLHELVRTRTGFRPVLTEFQYTNISFWYVPSWMRWTQHEPPTERWWQKLYSVTADIKERMVMRGTALVGYVPLLHKGIGNFFRMVVTCHPRPTLESMLFIVDEIERIGESLGNANPIPAPERHENNPQQPNNGMEL
ncbi:cysteine sulfinic acid decarboxylase [Anopheles darlingi]|uniref:cysteine sulfinic acid decarboxylase n=1 Tax=Anopheles darlingi TaxID=43151 RepID=UPI0021003A3C|nr:cysteine sulfinic acid decarboxylase [Anopheles darlingi]